MCILQKDLERLLIMICYKTTPFSWSFLICSSSIFSTVERTFVVWNPRGGGAILGRLSIVEYFTAGATYWMCKRKFFLYNWIRTIIFKSRKMSKVYHLLYFTNIFMLHINLCSIICHLGILKDFGQIVNWAVRKFCSHLLSWVRQYLSIRFFASKYLIPFSVSFSFQYTSNNLKINQIMFISIFYTFTMKNI